MPYLPPSPSRACVLCCGAMQWYFVAPPLSILVQAVIIIACQYNSATNLVVAQEAEVENPCLICPYGATAGDDYAPYEGWEDPRTYARKLSAMQNYSKLAAFGALNMN